MCQPQSRRDERHQPRATPGEQCPRQPQPRKGGMAIGRQKNVQVTARITQPVTDQAGLIHLY